jgi:hypothetical protein
MLPLEPQHVTLYVGLMTVKALTSSRLKVLQQKPAAFMNICHDILYLLMWMYLL